MCALQCAYGSNGYVDYGKKRLRGGLLAQPNQSEMINTCNGEWGEVKAYDGSNDTDTKL